MLEKLAKFNLSLGSWFGIPLILHWSWLLMFLIWVVVNPPFSLVWAGLFFIVILHEFGHCLMAQRLGSPVDSVTLYPVGGIARMEIPTRPSYEMLIALAGPAVNVALIPIFAFLPSNPILDQIGAINIGLLVFNLIPCFPMDGGRVFRAGLVMLLKDYGRATRIACWVSRAFCILFGVAGIWFHTPMLLVIGIVMWAFSESELHRIKIRHLLEVDLAASGSSLSSIQRRLAELDS